MKTVIIATAGKGGVGKTSLSAAIVRQLHKYFPDKKILAIDADPAIGLSTALGIEPEHTVDDIRKAIVENVEDGKKKEAVELLNEAKYRIFNTLTEMDGFSFLAIGRPESSGCYCKVNGYLKEIIGLIADSFDYVVIDGEAGIEQVNRRVMEKVTHLVLITDPSKKGANVVNTVKKVADELVMYEKIGVIVNRVCEGVPHGDMAFDNIPVLAVIGEDKKLQTFDIQGKSVFDLPDDAKVVTGATEALKNLKIITEVK